MSRGEQPLRASPVVLQRFNPQIQQYATIGQFPMCAIQKQGNFVLILFNANKPFMAISVTSTTQWTVQNELCCSYTDERHNIFVFQFPSKEEAQIFSAIALYQKLVSSKEPLCILKGDKGIVDPTNSFNVNFVAYDLMMKQIKAPIRNEENFTISSFDDTPIKEVAGKGEYGSTFLVMFAPGVVAIVDVLAPVSMLPSLPQLSGTSSNDGKTSTAHKEKSKEKKNKKSHKKDKNKRRGSTDNVNTSDSTPIEKKEEVHEEEEEELPFDQQLNDIRKTMNDLYMKAKADIASLYRSQALKSGVKPSDDDLVSSLQRLINQNTERELVIDEKRNLIDLLKHRDVDTTEVEKIRMQIGETSTKLSLQKATNRNLEEKISEIRHKIEQEEAKLIQARVEAEAAKEIAISNANLKKETKRGELKIQIEELKWELEKEQKLLAETKDRFDFEKNEMERIAQAHKEDYSEQYNKIKEQMNTLSDQMKKEYQEGVTSMIVSNFEPDKEYPQKIALGAIRTAFSNQTEDMFGEEEDEEEE